MMEPQDLPRDGDPAPDFTLPDAAGKPVSLKQYRRKKVVLYFYPQDDTPGCTKEACSFRDNLSQVTGRGAVILGVSPDGKDSHRKFINKYGLPFTLLSDANKEVLKLYNVWRLKNLYGKQYWGVERSTFIIDEHGMITKVFRKVRVDNHTQEVLEAL